MVLNIKAETQGFDISGKSVCIIGCGGLGCNVAVHLTGAGIGRLYLCDFDRVAEENLNRQFMYTAGDIGSYKCEVMKKKLSEYAPESEIITVNRKINEASDMKFSKECDMIFSCVDNRDARIVLENFCRENSIPLLHGGIDGFYGISYLYVPSHSPSPSQAGLCEGGRVRYNVSAVAGVIGSLQASLGMRYLISGDDSLSGRIFVFDENKTDTLNLNF